MCVRVCVWCLWKRLWWIVVGSTTHTYIHQRSWDYGWNEKRKKNRRDLNKKGQNGKWVVECCLMYYQQHRLWGEGEEERIKKGNMCLCVLRFSSILWNLLKSNLLFSDEKNDSAHPKWERERVCERCFLFSLTTHPLSFILSSFSSYPDGGSWSEEREGRDGGVGERKEGKTPKGNRISIWND